MLFIQVVDSIEVQMVSGLVVQEVDLVKVQMAVFEVVQI